jgi:hypothetical protein
MSFKLILNLLSFTILVWLLISSSSQISIAATKNRHLIDMEKETINNLNNIDSVKAKARLQLDQMSGNFEENSRRAVKKSWLILFVLIIQIALLFSTPKTRHHEFNEPL